MLPDPDTREKLVETLRVVLGDDSVLVDPTDRAPYEQGARQDHGRAAFVMRPKDNAALRTCVSLCAQAAQQFVVQSGNTGLVGASIPNQTGDVAVLSLDRLREPPQIDVENNSVTVSAGTRLSEINQALAPHGLTLPIDLGADPMVGGMIGANTGGARFIQHRDMRNFVLGLDVVLKNPGAQVLSLGSALHKNNTGPDLKHLFIGSGDRFGIVTSANLRVVAAPQQRAAALLVPRDEDAVLPLLLAYERRAGPLLSAFEFMSPNAMQAALDHVPGLQNPFSGDTPQIVLLVELSRPNVPADWETDLDDILQAVTAEIWETDDEPLLDALFGKPEKMWHIRHAVSEGVKHAGELFAFDLAFRRQDVMAFRKDMLTALPAQFPGVMICDFGHVGDGGLHFNLVRTDACTLPRDGFETTLRDWVMQQAVDRFGGSFSAEHGIGPKNQRYFDQYTPRMVRNLLIEIEETLYDAKECK